MKNGPDRRIINRNGSVTWIQDKYYAKAIEGINACFDENGVFRYIDGDGNPMIIEVPKDQYDDAVKAMQQKIEEGKIPNVTDVADAKNLVKKGSLTYKQARNIAKAGNLHSLTYDASKGIVNSTYAFGISTVIDYTVYRINGQGKVEALKNAGLTGVKSGGVVFATTVITNQLAKTSAIKAFAPSTEALTKVLGKGFTDAVIKSANNGVNSLSGAAATSHAAKILRTQGVAVIVTTVVLSTDDIVDIIQGEISKEQLIKNLAVTLAGAGGATGGAIGGAAAGSSIAPGVGTVVGGIAGGIAGGVGAEYGAEKIASLIYAGDAEKMLRVIEQEFQPLSEDYLITEDEANKIAKKLQEKLSGDTLKKMYKSDDRNEYARKLMEPLFEEQIKARKFEEPTEDELRRELKKSMKESVFIH